MTGADIDSTVQRMTDNRMSGLALILGSVGSIITMALHPTGHDLQVPGQLTPVTHMIVAVHALALICLPVMFLGAWGLSMPCFAESAFHDGAGLLRIRVGGRDECGGGERIHESVHRGANGQTGFGDARYVARDVSLQRTIESGVRNGVCGGCVSGDFVVVGCDCEKQRICDERGNLWMHSWAGDDCRGGVGTRDFGSARIWDDRFVRGDLVRVCGGDIDADENGELEEMANREDSSTRSWMARLMIGWRTDSGDYHNLFLMPKMLEMIGDARARNELDV